MDFFITESGIPVPAVTADQMREVDRIAMNETGPNLFQMMENAGRSLAEMTLEIAGGAARVVVLAGSGGNGGGGICAARHLANRGASVRLCLSNPDRLTEVTAFQLHIFRHTPGKVIEMPHLEKEPADIIIDALIGYSLEGPPGGDALRLIQWANAADAPILSLDVPSGVDATTGDTPGAYIQPQWTLTLALPKTGLLPHLTGKLFLADIGIPAGVYQRIGLPYQSPFGEHFRVVLTV